MNTYRWTMVLLGIASAGLLCLLLLTDLPPGLVRPTAIALWLLAIGAAVLATRGGNAELREFRQANVELGERLAVIRQQLAAAQDFNRDLIGELDDPAVVVNRDLTVAALNEAARKRVGASDGDAGPLMCYTALHGQQQPCDADTQPCALEQGQPCSHIRTGVDADGEERAVEVRAAPIYDQSGQVSGAVEVLHRLSDEERFALNLLRRKEDAETAHRARAAFVATMSHEVRTPLNAVLGMTDLLRLTELTRKQKSYVQIMESSSNMLLSLMDNMIDFATLESGELVLEEESFHVTDLLERVLEVMGYQAYSKGIELAGATDYEPDMQVTGDFQRLRQILINLVSNAVRFTERGEVIVGVNADRDESGRTLLSIMVSDSGIGMTKSAAEQLFTPFRSIADELDRRGHGSGLGLALSKRLVELMGGDINFESELGRGTNIWITVPVGRAAGGTAAVFEGRDALSNRRVLLVNDNEKVTFAVCSHMEAWNMSCEAEARPDHVAARLASAAESGYPYDCIVIDAQDASEDQLALARAVRRDSDIPIILLTSIAQPLKVGDISSIGRIRCVNKPVLPSELRHNLRRLFEQNAGEAQQTTEESFRALRILVAEDNPINRKLLTSMLNSIGFEVQSASDGPEVLSLVEHQAFDLILMDCQMPGMDGDEVTRIIRTQPGATRAQPVIVAVTADVSGGHKDRCLEAGMDDFLAKPVRLDTLKSGLRRWSYMADARRPQDDGFAHDASPAFASRLRDATGVVDADVLDEFINLFLDDTRSRLEIMKSALDKQDVDTIRRECHALKGACLELGVSRLGSCCDALGQASRDLRLDDLPAELHRLTAEFERVRPIFEAGRSRSA